MKFNFRKFLLCFAILQAVVFVGGCSATWLTAVGALLPALEAAVAAAISFVVALEGKTVPPAVSAAIQKIGADIKAQIANAQTLIADYQKAATTGLLSQIQAVFQGVVDNLASILSAFNVTDSASISKFTQLVGLCVAAAQAVLAMIPLVAAKLALPATQSQLEHEDKVAASTIQLTNKTMQETYRIIVSEDTPSAIVNEALATLPKTI